MCDDYMLKNSIELSIIYIGIVNRYFEIIDENQPIELKQLHIIASCDNGYSLHWAECAQNLGLIRIDNSTITLTSLGRHYLFHNPNGKIHVVLRSIYSIILTNECMGFFKTGHVPGYSIIFSEPFRNLIPQYGYISRKTYLDSFHEIVKHKEIAAILDNAITIADWGCGGAWFINELSCLYPQQKYVGIDIIDIVEKNRKVYVNKPRISFVEENQVSQKCFDVIFINHTYHHFSDKPQMLARISANLSQNGSIIIWDYVNEESHDSEIAFLDLIEHIQGARFYSKKEIIEELKAANLEFSLLSFGKTNEVLIIANPS